VSVLRPTPSPPLLEGNTGWTSTRLHCAEKVKTRACSAELRLLPKKTADGAVRNLYPSLITDLVRHVCHLEFAVADIYASSRIAF
jgi:hypothetical protein